MEYENLNDLSKEGLIKRFEYTFELFLPTLQDFLLSEGIEAKFPRDIIKKAFKYEIVKDGETWLDMLEKRNVLSHIYNEENFRKALELIIGKYYCAMVSVYNYLRKSTL